MQRIVVWRLQREYASPEVLIEEAVMEQRQSALRYRWQPWVWAACLPVLARWFGWLPRNPGVSEPSAGMSLTVVAASGWSGLARLLAGPAMTMSAAARVRRLQRAGEACLSHGRAMSMTPFSTMPAPTRVSPT